MSKLPATSPAIRTGRAELGIYLQVRPHLRGRPQAGRRLRNQRASVDQSEATAGDLGGDAMSRIDRSKETQVERCRRVLAGVPKVKRGSDLLFDYEKASKQCEAMKGVKNELRDTPTS